MSRTSFVFAEDYEFDWPVHVSYPGRSGQEERAFTVRFRLPDEDEIARLFFPERLTEEKARGYAEAVADDRALLGGLIVGWSGIGLEGGGELAFSPEALDKLLRQRPIRRALGEAASAAFFGPENQRQKN